MRFFFQMIAPRLERPVHLAHPAAADLRNDAVTAYFFPTSIEIG